MLVMVTVMFLATRNVLGVGGLGSGQLVEGWSLQCPGPSKHSLPSNINKLGGVGICLSLSYYQQPATNYPHHS